MSLTKVWIKWGQLNVNWGQIHLTWSEIYTFIEITTNLGSGTGGIVVDKDKVWDSVNTDLEKRGYTEEARDKFLKVVVKVNGLEKDLTRNMDEIKKSITVDHIKNTIKKAAPNVRVQAINVKRNG